MISTNKRDFKMSKIPPSKTRKRLTIKEFLEKMNDAICDGIISPEDQLEYIHIDGLNDVFSIELADWYDEPMRKEKLNIKTFKNLVTIEDLSSEEFKKVFLELIDKYGINYLMAWLDGPEDNGIRVEYEDKIYEKDYHEKFEM